MNIRRQYRFVAFTGFLIFAISVLPAAAAGTSAVSMIPNSFSQLAAAAKPAVVNISTVKVSRDGGRVFRHFFGNPFGNQDPFNRFFEPFLRQNPQQERKQQSLGSGFIVSPDGYIVTNNHVVEDADEITVKLSNEKEYKASVVGTDPNTDLALIKIDGKDFTWLKLGDSKSLEVGSWVVAIGSPFGLEQTVTAGIVSAKGRIIGSGPYDNFIQTDASINPGNSGGPLLNLEGDVVGINTAIIASGQGIGFAIPSELAKGIVDQLRDSGEVTRGWMGVAIQDITPELADYFKIDKDSAVLVAKVYKDNPADLAGIQAGDVITHIEGTPVKSSRDLSSLIAGYGVGKKITVSLIRNGKQLEKEVVLTKRSDTDPESGSVQQSGSDVFGLGLKELTPMNARTYGYPEQMKGLVVAEIKPDGKAAATGIREGDLLKEVNHQAVTTLDEYQGLLDKVDSGETVRLLFQRGNTSFIAIQLVK